MPEAYHPFVLCCGPGVLRGVHCAGVMEALFDHHLSEPDENGRILKQLKGIRACSAGVPSSLFFAVARTREEVQRGADIYTSDLTGPRFLNVHRILHTYAHSAWRLCSRSAPAAPPVVDVDYLMGKIAAKLPEDYRDRLRSLPFDYDAEVFNRTTQRVEAVSLKTAADPLRIVRESIAAIPGVSPPPGQAYVDAGVQRSLFDHGELRRTYPPPHRIVYIANEPPPDGIIDRSREWITRLLYGLASLRDGVGPRVFLDGLHQLEDQVQCIRSDALSLLVVPRFRPPLRETTKKPNLWRLRREGQRHMPRILRFLSTNTVL